MMGRACGDVKVEVAVDVLGVNPKGMIGSGGLRGLRATMVPLARRNWLEEGQRGFLPMSTAMTALSVDLRGTWIVLDARERCCVDCET